MTRNGKIARLPFLVREELNQRLNDGAEGQPLLDWLNQLPDTHEMLSEGFDGAPINKQNLSEWRQGGFVEWQLRTELFLQAESLAQGAEKLDDLVSDHLLVDDVATVLAARYGALLANWNGEPDPKVEATLRLLGGVCLNIVRLQRGLQRAAERDAEIKRVRGEERRHEFGLFSSEPPAALLTRLKKLKAVQTRPARKKSPQPVKPPVIKPAPPLPPEPVDPQSHTEPDPTPDAGPGQTQSSPVKPKKSPTPSNAEP